MRLVRRATPGPALGCCTVPSWSPCPLGTRARPCTYGQPPGAPSRAVPEARPRRGPALGDSQRSPVALQSFLGSDEVCASPWERPPRGRVSGWWRVEKTVSSRCGWPCRGNRAGCQAGGWALKPEQRGHPTRHPPCRARLPTEASGLNTVCLSFLPQSLLVELDPTSDGLLQSPRLTDEEAEVPKVASCLGNSRGLGLESVTHAGPSRAVRSLRPGPGVLGAPCWV